MNTINIKDILEDVHFTPWVEEGKYQDYWMDWKKSHPEHMDLLLDAVAMKQGLSVANKKIDKSEIQSDFIRLQKMVNQRSQKKARVYWLASAAAAVALLIGSFFFFKTSTPLAPIQFQASTQSGQMQELTLPDASTVVLNSNSQLTYLSEDNSDVRRVDLVGEALFSVQKQMGELQPKKFIVHTMHGEVEVLGTTFSVNSDNIWTTVVLEEGSVRLTLRSQQAGVEEVITLVPGEKVVFNSETGQILQYEVDATAYNMWTDHKLSLVDRSMEELLRWFQHNYAIQIDLPDGYLDNKLTGTISTNDANTAIKMMSVALGLEAVKIDDTKWILE